MIPYFHLVSNFYSHNLFNRQLFLFHVHSLRMRFLRDLFKCNLWYLFTCTFCFLEQNYGKVLIIFILHFVFISDSLCSSKTNEFNRSSANFIFIAILLCEALQYEFIFSIYIFFGRWIYMCMYIQNWINTVKPVLNWWCSFQYAVLS